MTSVTFTPHYTLRADSTGMESCLHIRYQARISNTSGEDWNDVSLAISTAQASETTVIPQLMRWTVDFFSNQPAYMNKSVSLAKQARSGFGGAQNINQMQAQVLWRSDAPALPGYGGVSSEEGGYDGEIGTAAAEVSEGITSTFIIPGKQTIKDGEKSHTVVIRDLTLEGKFANIIVPKIKDQAYLQARVKNHTDYPLLPGEVAIFLDGAFVGKTEFAYVAPGEFLNVCLGYVRGSQALMVVSTRVSR
jgi:uncharacterized protein (TIGR02231 family)